MYERAVYTDVVAEVSRELEEAVGRAVAAGVPREAIIVDPGFGFAKQAAHSFELLASSIDWTRSTVPCCPAPRANPT